MRLFYVGMIGFTVVLTSMFLSFGGPLGWWSAIPIGLVFFVIALYVRRMSRRARASRTSAADATYREAAVRRAARGRTRRT